MAKYIVTMELDLDDDSNPRKWVADTIADVLHPSEDITDINYKEVDEDTVTAEVKYFVTQTLSKLDTASYSEEFIGKEFHFKEDDNGTVFVYVGDTVVAVKHNNTILFAN